MKTKTLRVLAISALSALATCMAFRADAYQFMRERQNYSPPGSWSPANPNYTFADTKKFNGTAVITNLTYSPNIPSCGDTVSVRMHLKFLGQAGDEQDGAQALLRMVDYRNRRMFQVWSGSEWIYVMADNVDPNYDVEYTVDFAFDYSYRTYTVNVDGGQLKSCEDGRGDFALASSAKCVSAVNYGGTAFFHTTLEGNCSTNYPYAWRGAGGNGNWTTVANWYSDAAPSGNVEPRFTEGLIEENGRRTVNFTSANSFNGVLRIAAGTASNPLVFSASSAANGLSNEGKGLWISEFNSTVMRFESGTWNFGEMRVGYGNDTSAVVTNQGGSVTTRMLRIAVGRNSFGEYCNKGGTTTVNGTVTVGGYNGNEGDATVARLVVDGGSVYSTDNIFVADFGLPGAMSSVSVMNGGELGCAGRLFLAQRGAGTLDIANGTVSVNTGVMFCNNSLNEAGEDGILNLGAGGTLATRWVAYGSGSGHGYFNFNGGTLRAIAGGTLLNRHDNLTCVVNAGGGTIDNGGFSFKIASSLEGPGALTLTGAGAVEFASSNVLGNGVNVNGGVLQADAGVRITTGGLRMAGGTKYIGPASGEAPSIGGALTLAGSGNVTVQVGTGADLAVGSYTLLVTTSNLSGITNRLTLANHAVEGATARIAALGGNSQRLVVVVSDSADDNQYVWTGAGDNNLLNNPYNWLDKKVPDRGGGTVFFATDTDKTVDCNIANFSPSNVVFTASSAKFTFGGSEPFRNVFRIANASPANHVFNVPVNASPDASLVIENASTYCSFQAGLEMALAPRFATSGGEKAYIVGAWHVAGDMTEPPSGVAISQEGSSLLIDGTLTAGYNIGVLDGARLQASRVQHGLTRTPRTLWKNAGTFVVTDEIARNISTGGGNASEYGFSMFGFGGAGAVTKTRSIVHAASTYGRAWFALNNGSDSVTNRIVVGEGGISFHDNRWRHKTCVPYFEIAADKAVTLGAYADWTFGGNGLSDVNTNLSLQAGSTVIFDTSDYESASVGRTITVDGAIVGEGAVAVKGRGKVAFNRASPFTGGLAVSDTATLAFARGAAAVSGCLTMQLGTKLEVPYGEPLAVSGAFAVSGGSGKVGVRLGSESTPACGRVKVLTSPVAFGAGVTASSFTLLNQTLSGTAATFSIEGNGKELWVNAGDGYIWSGAGDGKWSSGSNWYAGAKPEGNVTVRFLEESAIGRTATFAEANSFNGVLRIAAGTASNPLVFSASSAANGLSNEGNGLWISESNSTVMRFESGTWNFGDMLVGYGNDTSAVVTNQGGGVTTRMLRIAVGRNSFGEYCNKGGTTTVNGAVTIGGYNGNEGDANVARLVVDGGSVYSTDSIYVADFGLPGAMSSASVMNGGELGCAGRLFLAQRSAGALDIADGTVSVNIGVMFCNDSRNEAGEDGILNLGAGGTLATRWVAYGSGSGHGYFNFNGGTLRAIAGGTLLNRHDNLTYVVNAGGGTIDNGGFNVTIASPLEGTGALTLSGSGTTTLSQSRALMTTVAEGKLKMANGATLDGAKLKLGSGADKAAALDYAGQDMAFDLTSAMSGSSGSAAGGDVTICNGQYTLTSLLRIVNGSLTVAGGAHVTMDPASAKWVCVGGQSSVDGATGLDSALMIDGGSVTNDTAYHLGIGDYGTAPSKARVVVRNGGTYYGRGDIYVAQGNTASLTVDGAGSSVTALGSLKFCNSVRDQADEPGYVVLTNGGTLAVKDVSHGTGAGNGYFCFDGGTLRALADGTLLAGGEKISYRIGGNGGIIDNNGKSVTVAGSLDGEGALALVGPGTTHFASGNVLGGGVSVSDGTLSAAAGVRITDGGLSMAGGTTLVIPSSGQAPTIGGALCVTGSGNVGVKIGSGESIASGIYTILDTGASVEGVTGRFALVNATPDGMSATFAAGGEGGRNLVLVVLPAGQYVWTGAGVDARMSNADNWLDRRVPNNGGETVYFECDADTAVKCDLEGFAPSNVIFSAGSAKFSFGDGTAGGSLPFTNVFCIANASSVNHVFNVPVYGSCGDANATFTIDNASAYCMFPGGLTMSSGPTFATTGGEKAYVSGRWHVLGDWSLPPAGCKVAEGSTLVIDGTFDKGNKLSVLSGAVLRAANYTHGSSSEPRVLWDNRGEFIVTNELTWTIETISTTTQYTFNMFNYATADAVTKARAVVHNASTHGDATFRLSNGSDSVTNRIVVGEGGISFRDNHRRRKTCVPLFDIAAGKAVELGAYADWTFGTNGLFIVSTNLVLGTGSAVFFDTTDSETPSLGRTITVEGAIAGDGAVVVKGRGKLALGATSYFKGGMDVKDTATLALASGVNVCESRTTVFDGATLEVSGEGNELGALELQPGSTIKFSTLTSANSALKVENLSLLGTGVAIIATPASGHAYTIFQKSGEGDFSGVPLTRFIRPQGWSVRLSSDSRSIMLEKDSEFYWTGAADNCSWVASGNWLRGAAPSGTVSAHFAAEGITGRKTAEFDVAANYNGCLFVYTGTAESPVVFRSNSATVGLSATQLSLGYFGDGALWLDGGMYRFTSGAVVGAESGKVGRLAIGGDQAETTVDFRPSVFYLYPGSTVCGTNAELLAKRFHLHGGSIALTNVNLTASEYFCSGYMANSATFIEKVGGDWAVTNVLRLGKANCAKTVFYHRGGSILAGVGSANQWFALGDGLDSTNEFYNIDGTLTVSDWLLLGNNASSAHGRNYFEIAGGTVSQTGGGAHVVIGYKCGAGTSNELRVKGGVLNARQDVFVGGKDVDQGGGGVLVVDGGEVNAPGGYVYVGRGGNGGEVALNGGTLLTKQVRHGGGAQAGTFAFNGGTLKASAAGTLIEGSSKFSVTVGAGGGVIDNNGNDIAITAQIGGTGALSMIGSGKTHLASGVDLRGDVSVAGGCSLEIEAGARITASNLSMAGGTTLVIPSSDQAPTIGGALSVTGNGNVGIRIGSGDSIASGRYTILATGASVADVAGRFTLVNATPDGMSATFAAGGEGCRNLVLVIAPEGQYVWTGAGADARMSNADNWLGRRVPNNGGETVYFECDADTTVKCDLEGFAPSNVIFAAGSAKFSFGDGTAGGSLPFTNVFCIANASSVNHVFNVPVYGNCGDANATFTIDNASAYCMFPGGLTMSSGPTFATTGGEKAYVSGRWHVLGDWSLPPAACKVTEGSTLVVDGTFDKGNKLSVLSGAVLRAANYTHGSSSEPRVLWDNRGEFIVTNELAWTIETISTTTQYTFNMFNYATADAVTKARAVVHNASTHGDATFRLSNGSDSVTNRIVVGEGGISFRDNHRRRKTCVPFFDIAAGKAVELGAYADWTFGTNGLFIVSTNLVLGTGSAVFFDTTDSETPSLGRTITVEGAIAGDGAVVVKGRGKLALNGAGSSFSGGLTVKDTATLAVGQSSTAGVGDVSMERGTTMELSYGETLDIGGAFTVAGGSGTVQIRLGPNAAAPVNGRIKLLSATSIDFGGAAPSDVFALANATFGSAVATFSVESNGTELWLNAPVSRFNEGDKVGLAKCVTLTQAQADWLNGFDDFDAMNTALAEVAADCFMEAFLLNLDVRETGWRSWTFVHTEITATPVDGGIRSVKVVATLTRGHSPKTGKNAPINGTVKLCSVDLATGQLTVVPGAVADDPKFANGDAATFEFESRDEGCCYRAIIE